MHFFNNVFWLEYRKVFISIFMLFFIFCINKGQVYAQKTSYENILFLSGIPIQSPEKIKERIKGIEDDKELDQTLKTKMLTQYRQTLNSLDLSGLYDNRSQMFSKFLNEASTELERIKSHIQQINIEKKGLTQKTDVSALTTPELDRRYAILQSEILLLKESIGLLDKQIEWQKSRPAGIKEELANARKMLHDVDEELKTGKTVKENTLLIEARRTALMALRQARIKEIQMLNNELACYGHQLRILDAQRELENGKLEKTQLEAKPYEKTINERLKIEMEKSRASTALEENVRKKIPIIRSIAEKNIGLGKEIEEANKDIKQTTSYKDSTQTLLKQIEQNISDMKKKTEVAGLGKAVGHIILEQLRNLPDVKIYEKSNKKLEKKIRDVWFQQTKVDELMRPLYDINKEVKRTIAESVDTDINKENLIDIEDEIRSLLNERKELLIKLSDVLAAHLGLLGELEETQKQLITSIDEYSDFLESKVLWIPNAQPIGKKVFEDFMDTVTDILTLSNFADIPKTLFEDTKRNPMLVLLFFIVIVPIFWSRKHLLVLIESIGKKVIDPVTDNFMLTIETLFFVLIAVLPLPLVLGFMGWRFLDGLEATVFTRALGSALLVLSCGIFYFRFVYLVCSKKGLAEVHFNWDAEMLARLRIELNWYFSILLISIFLFVFFWSIPHVEKGGPGRFFMIIPMIATAILLYRLLNPNYGLFRKYLNNHRSDWLYKLRYVWYPLAIAIPLVLAYMVSAGYIYTAIKLISHSFDTFWLITGVVILHSLVIRWISITNRRMVLRKRDNVDENQGIEVPIINLQTKKLLNIFIGTVFIVGLLLIWAKIFPALSVLEQISLWHNTTLVGSKEVQQSVTLLDLMLAIIFTIATIIVARNIPGALDIILLRNLPISAGSSYAITHLARYTIVMIGVIAVFKTMGVGWSNIHWLVAALGVGLGFGLQEIFGNLISGIIILFEKPIRLGDTVTIGDVTGTVSRINVRATTIVDWDYKELIIPNKSFITGQLVNWTLTSPITRIKIKVGIAYGSDTKLAHKIILDTVKANPLVLENPGPSVGLLGFGDSSLEFTAFAYARQLSDRFQLTHELHIDIERALQENGIAIPFPQRDIHIKE